jgi:hypothetical protein
MTLRTFLGLNAVLRDKIPFSVFKYSQRQSLLQILYLWRILYPWQLLLLLPLRQA